MEFKQRRFFNTRKFLLKEDGVEVTLRENLNLHNTFLSYEELDFKRTNRVRKFNWTWIVLTGVFLFGFIFNLSQQLGRETTDNSFIVPLLGQLSLIGLLLIWFTRVDNIYIPTDRGSYLILYASSPAKKKVSDFIEQLKSRAKEGVLKKFEKQDKTDMPGLLAFIKDRGMIEEEEFKTLELKYKKAENKIGFDSGID